MIGQVTIERKPVNPHLALEGEQPGDYVILWGPSAPGCNLRHGVTYALSDVPGVIGQKFGLDGNDLALMARIAERLNAMEPGEQVTIAASDYQTVGNTTREVSAQLASGPKVIR